MVPMLPKSHKCQNAFLDKIRQNQTSACDDDVQKLIRFWQHLDQTMVRMLPNPWGKMNKSVCRTGAHSKPIINISNVLYYTSVSFQSVRNAKKGYQLFKYYHLSNYL